MKLPGIGNVQRVVEVRETGMTLRDYFAASALAGLSAQHETLLGNNSLVGELGTLGIDKLQANKAYRLADAMLAEREKKG